MTAPDRADERCPRCGAQSRRSHMRGVPDRNRRVSRERFVYRRCTSCGVEWLTNPPADIARYYPGGYHTFWDAAELPEAARKEQERLTFVTDLVSGGQLVEIGPSQGVFSYSAARSGFDVTALEMDEECCANLRDVIGVTTINTAVPQDVLPTLKPSRAIVMWHVLEHVPDPWTLLRAIAGNLEPGGVFALATPNPRALQRRLFGTRWIHFDAPRHVQFIPLEALVDELGAYGMQLRRATATDHYGLECDRLGWQRSLLPGAKLRPDPRVAFTLGRTLGPLMAPVERRGLRGTTYTAVFQKHS